MSRHDIQEEVLETGAADLKSLHFDKAVKAKLIKPHMREKCRIAD
jgi:hypothetical protein